MEKVGRKEINEKREQLAPFVVLYFIKLTYI